MAMPRKPTLLRDRAAGVERFPTLEDLARRLHQLRGALKLALRDAVIVYGDLEAAGWSVWTVNAEGGREWLGAVCAPGLEMPPLRQVLAATARPAR
jgi:hypothetical protein